MRRIALTFALLAAAPLAAQQQQAMEKDPTIKVRSTGLPDGWTIRLDDKERRYTAEDTKFERMGAGYHVTSGPAALYFHEAHTVGGPFTVQASLTQTKAPTHAEAYGIFIGGAELLTPKQQYLYLLVRRDGKYFVAHRAGAEVHKIVDWTEHAAVKKQDDAGAQSNILGIQVTADSVHFKVNHQAVRSFAKAEMHGFDTSGQVGLRVNHNLDIHIGSFGVSKD